MDRKNIAWLILTSVILLVLISLTIPILYADQHGGDDQGSRPAQQDPQKPAPAGREEAKQLKTIISFVNIGLIIPLFILYLGIYRTVKSSFTFGLIAVIAALGMYAVTSCPLIVGLFGSRPGDIGLFQILPDLCTTAALLILVRISYE